MQTGRSQPLIEKPLVLFICLLGRITRTSSKMPEDNMYLKSQVRQYWDDQPCGTQYTDKEKYTKQYFDEIESERYLREPEIFSFAQFTRFYGAKVLEVGVGAGSDFMQWIRSGAHATGIDATTEGIRHVSARLDVYNLQCEDLIVADCEKLPFPDNSFDLVYSWGVIHHTPNTEQALAEIVRVCRPGGQIKVMVYHRYSLVTFFLWTKYALLRARPWKTLSWCLAHYMESPGTKAYSKQELKEMVIQLPVSINKIVSYLTYYDRLGRFNKPARVFARALALIGGMDRIGWFLTIDMRKLVK